MDAVPNPSTPPTPAEPPVMPFPGIAQGFGVLGIWMAFTIPASIPALVARLVHFPRTAAWLTLLGSLAATAGALWIASQWGRCSWRAFFPHRRVSASAWFGTLFGALGLVLVLNGVDNLFQHLWPAPAWLEGMLMDAGVPVVVLGAALTEEPLCRGVLLRGFRARYGANRAMVYSALLFALVHLNPWQAIGAFFLGLYFAWLVQRTGSIWPAVLGHAVNNGIALLAMRQKWPSLGDHTLQPFSWWVAGALLTVVGLNIVRQATQDRIDAESVPTAVPLSLEVQP